MRLQKIKDISALSLLISADLFTSGSHLVLHFLARKHLNAKKYMIANEKSQHWNQKSTQCNHMKKVKKETSKAKKLEQHPKYLQGK